MELADVLIGLEHLVMAVVNVEAGHLSLFGLEVSLTSLTLNNWFKVISIFSISGSNTA